MTLDPGLHLVDEVDELVAVDMGLDVSMPDSAKLLQSVKIEGSAAWPSSWERAIRRLVRRQGWVGREKARDLIKY